MRLTLSSGRTIHLVRLAQHRTYEELLCGYPHSRMNASIIERLLNEAENLLYPRLPTRLIAPQVISLEGKRPAPQALRALGARPLPATDGSEFRTFERLPEVASIGVFDSGALARPNSEPFSSMTLAWFQDDFGPPVADAVRSQIEALDWEALAKDWCS